MQAEVSTPRVARTGKLISRQAFRTNKHVKRRCSGYVANSNATAISTTRYFIPYISLAVLWRMTFVAGSHRGQAFHRTTRTQADSSVSISEIMLSYISLRSECEPRTCMEYISIMYTSYPIMQEHQ